MSAREEILARVRAALADGGALADGAALADGGAPPPVQRGYRTAAEEAPAGSPGLVDRFEERALDYRARVHRCVPGEVGATLAAVIVGRGSRRVVVPGGFPADWLDMPPGVEAVSDDPPLPAASLDAVGSVVTTCRLAVAETGTIVLDGGPGQGRRALTLVPDHHVVVVRPDQVVEGVPAAVAAVDPTRPLTWISGPSATSDIELSRVEGVHGPRTLEVILVSGHHPRHAGPLPGAAP